ncbi:MAG: arginine deiminase family protein [Candidatus Acidiferrales bacterium]
MAFRNAIVRRPAGNFADGLTSVELGRPSHEKAVEQHGHYCEALARCGLQLTVLEADLRYPDSTFVEDVAILAHGSAILTRPGAPSRQGEVTEIRGTIREHFSVTREITSPGTLDGGDVCEADDHYFIGISKRTNEEGARQLAQFLALDGCTSSCIDIRSMETLLHLKSGIAYLGEGNFVATSELYNHLPADRYKILRVHSRESYAANCLRINEHVLVPSGFPGVRAAVEQLGYATIALDMSEYQKMDGGLTCLSLRF